LAGHWAQDRRKKALPAGSRLSAFCGL